MKPCGQVGLVGETDLQRDFRQWLIRSEHQLLRAPDPTLDQKCVRADAEALLEGAAEVAWSEVRDLSELRHRDAAAQMILDIGLDALDLPGRQPSGDGGRR